MYAFGAVHVRVAEERTFPPAEGVIRHRHRYRHIDAHHARLHIKLELPRRSAVSGEDGRPVAPRVFVDERHCFSVGVRPQHAQHGAENLVAVAVHLWGHMIKQGCP